jgi:hypothetical protein
MGMVVLGMASMTGTVRKDCAHRGDSWKGS